MAKRESELRGEMKQKDPNLKKVPPTIDGIPMDAYIRQERVLNERGMTTLYGDSGEVDDPTLSVAGMEPYKGELFQPDGTDVHLSENFNPTQDVGTVQISRRLVSPSHAMERAQMDSIIKGNTDDYGERVRQYSNGVRTVQDDAIEFLEEQYSQEFLDQGVLSQIDENTSPEEAARLVLNETQRLNANKAEMRQLIAMNLMRQGFADAPSEMIDHIRTELTPTQAQALMSQYRQQHIDEVQQTLDRIAAVEGEGFTHAAASAEIVMQDVAPFYGATTRIIGTNKFLPDGVEMGVIRRGFPGEVRQEIREWWVDATPQERREYLDDIERTWQEIRQGSNSKFYTRILVLENLMGVFTDELLQDNNATDTFDRVMGNLDTGLGMLVGAGLFIKRGVSVFELWRRGKYNINGQVAAAGKAREAEEALDQAIKEQATAYGWTIEEASVGDLVKPKQMEFDFGIDVQTDSVKHITEPNQARRQRILRYTDEADTTLLTSAEKGDAVAATIKELEDLDGVHVMHKMSTLRGLDNNTGVELTVTLGQSTGKAWDNLSTLLDDLQQLDPYETFRIMRRGKNGKLEEVPVKFSEIVDYYSTGRVPFALEKYIEVSPEMKEVARYFGGRKLSSVPSHELSAALENGWIPPDMPAWGLVRRELDARANPELLKAADDKMAFIDGEEFFVQFDKTRYFDSGDVKPGGTNLVDGAKEGTTQSLFRVFGLNTTLSGAFSRLFPPNAKFDRLYTAARQNYQMEEAALAEFADMMVPFDTLSTKQKMKVNEIVEYVEDFAKEAYHINGRAERPTWAKLVEDFPDVDQKTWEGYEALTNTMDGMYEVLNRRLVRDFTNRGFRTMRGTDDSLPNFHGKPLDGDTASAGMYYDPVKREMVKLTKKEVDGILTDGGGFLELDFPITDAKGAKFTRVLARKGDYQIGKLSDTPLTKHEGYHFRFYEDPYYVLKRTYNPVVNGVTVTKKMVKSNPEKYQNYHIADDGRVYYDEAVSTAKTYNDGHRFLQRGGKKFFDNGKGELVRAGGSGSHTYVIKPSKQINNTEGSLYTTQQMHREGRLFWDERSYERLPDTTGNRAKITDPVRAVQKGLAMGMRQTTQEGLFKALKNHVKGAYGDLPVFSGNKFALESEDLGKLEETLKTGKAEAFGETRKRYSEAIELVRYMRTQLGTDSVAVPWLRQMLLHSAQWVENLTGKRAVGVHSAVQRWAMEVDPFATARKAAYYTFMVARPFRQALLQSSQISFLSGLEPKYIGSGKVFKDAYALRMGLREMRKAGVNDGWTDANLAKSMGLSKKEYKRVVEEFQRSGFLGSVNTHAFNAAGRGLKAGLPAGEANLLSRATYGTRSGLRNITNKFKKGFEWGEQNNLTMSWLVALRRVQRQRGIKDLTKMTRADWKEVAKVGDSLALGMTRPNKFAYQSGATGMVFQFMSFQHRAMLSMLGLNPAIKGADVLKIIGMNVALWGGNIMGAEEWARDTLISMGIDPSTELMPGISLADALASGFVETAFNGIASALTDNWSDLNLGVLAPGAALPTIYRAVMEAATEAPMESGTIFGPISAPVSGLSRGLSLIWSERHNATKGPAEKLLNGAAMLTYELFPQVSDVTRSIMAIQHQEWADKDGDRLGIQPTVNALIARGFFGIRPNEEMDVYRARQILWESEETIKGFVDDFKPYLKRLFEEYYYGDARSDEWIQEKFATVLSYTETAPEGIREEIFKRLLTEPDLEGQTLIDIIVEAQPVAGTNFEKLLPLIQNSSSLDAEQKRQLMGAINEAIEGNNRRDELHNNDVRRELSERGID